LVTRRTWLLSWLSSTIISYAVSQEIHLALAWSIIIYFVLLDGYICSVVHIAVWLKIGPFSDYVLGEGYSSWLYCEALLAWINSGGGLPYGCNPWIHCPLTADNELSCHVPVQDPRLADWCMRKKSL
jgi:hypothetical protein